MLFLMGCAAVILLHLDDLRIGAESYISHMQYQEDGSKIPATEKMKNGEKWDLLSALAAEKDFGLTKEQMRDILRPELYIGRCTQQVEEYLIKLKPLLDGITAASVEINL